MKSTVPPGREDFIAQIKKRLGRKLSEREIKVFCQVNLGVLKAVTEWPDDNDFADFVKTFCEDNPMARLLKKLVASRKTPQEDWQKILKSFDKKASKILCKFDFEASVNPFSNWLLALVRENPLPEKTRVLKFGLFESEGGFKLYVSAVNKYDAKDSDWATDYDCFFDNNFAPLDALSKLWKPLQKVNKEAWVYILVTAIILIRACFLRHGAEIKSISGLKKFFVVTGFDDGDLYQIKNCFP